MRPAARAGGVRLFVSGLALAVVGILLYVAPSRMGVVDLPMPWFAMVTAFVWGATRPGVALSAAAFGLGLAQDFVSGGPLGPFALAMITVYGVAALQRDALAGQSAAAVWIAFCLAVAAAAVAAWLGGWVALGQAPGVGALIWQGALTAALGAPTARLLGGFAAVGAANMERA